MQILKVAGDHRVAIVAKDCIEACVDRVTVYYSRYPACVWALKLEHFSRARGALGLLLDHRVSKLKQITCITIIIE